MRLRAGLRIVAVGIGAAFAGAYAAAEEMPKAEIVPQLGHSEKVTSVAFAFGGSMVVTGSHDGTLKLWDAESGREVHTFRRNDLSAFKNAALSPDSKLVAGAGFSKSVAGGGAENDVTVWDIANRRELYTLRTQFEINSIAFSPDNRILAAGGGRPYMDGSIELRDALNGRELLRWKTDQDTGDREVNSLAFSPDAKILASAVAGVIKLWEVDSGRELRTFAGSDPIAFSPNGRLIASGSCGKITVRDLTSGAVSLSRVSGCVNSVSFSPDSRLLTAGGWDAKVEFFDVETGRELASLGGHTDHVNSVAFSPNGRLAVSGSTDGTAKIWDVAARRAVHTLGGHIAPITSIALSRSGGLLAAGARDNSITLWDLKTGTNRVRRGHTEAAMFSVSHFPRQVSVNALAFSPDDRILASGSDDQTIIFWDVNGARQFQRFKEETGILALAFSPDGKLLASGSKDSKIRFREVSTGRQAGEISGIPGFWPMAIAYSPDGRTLASGRSDGTVQLWDATSGRELRMFHHAETPPGLGVLHGGEVTSITFSPNADLLATGEIFSGKTTTRIWEVFSGREIRTFAGRPIIFASEELLVTENEGEIKFWNLPRGVEVKTAPPLGGRWTASGISKGSIRLWDAKGKERVSLVTSFVGSPPVLKPEHQQKAKGQARKTAPVQGAGVTITADGFFTASQRDTVMLAIVRGFEATTMGRFISRSTIPIWYARRWQAIPMGRSRARQRLSISTRFSTLDRRL
jgi:WD40 repeat protein